MCIEFLSANKRRYKKKVQPTKTKKITKKKWFKLFLSNPNLERRSPRWCILTSRRPPIIFHSFSRIIGERGQMSSKRRLKRARIKHFPIHLHKRPTEHTIPYLLLWSDGVFKNRIKMPVMLVHSCTAWKSDIFVRHQQLIDLCATFYFR